MNMRPSSASASIRVRPVRHNSGIETETVMAWRRLRFSCLWSAPWRIARKFLVPIPAHREQYLRRRQRRRRHAHDAFRASRPSSISNVLSALARKERRTKPVRPQGIATVIRHRTVYFPRAGPKGPASAGREHASTLPIRQPGSATRHNRVESSRAPGVTDCAACVQMARSIKRLALPSSSSLAS